MSRFDYQGKVTTNVNRQGKKKRTLDRPKETPVVAKQPRSVGRNPNRKPILPNPGQAPTRSRRK